MTSKNKKHSFFTYYWCVDNEEEDVSVMRIYGVDRNNKNVCVIISDFLPYIYLELPVFINSNCLGKVQLIGDKIDNLLGKNRPIKKEFKMMHKLYGASLNEDGTRKLFPYLKCWFSCKHDVRKLSYQLKRRIPVVGVGTIFMKMHESDASEILQFTSSKDVPTAGWINFVGELVPEDQKVTLCDYEFKVKSDNVVKCNRNIIGKPLIMAFDIEVNSTNITAMPKSRNPGDKVFQISCVFGREGDDNYEPYLLTLGDPDQEITGNEIKIRRFNTEGDLIVGFTHLIREKNPNIISGFNILGFDMQYLLDRSKFNMCIGDFDKMGFHKYNHSKEKTIKWSSSAYKNQEFQYLDAEGRLFVDLLPIVRRDFKLDNYKLKTIAEEVLQNSTKDPLSVKGIFKCYRIGIKKEKDGTYSRKARKAMAVVGKYCAVDSILVLQLMTKMKTWTSLTEMACVCNVQCMTTYASGQQIKVYSQVYKFCYDNNIVVEKDGYVAAENEAFVGAKVWDPVPGIYDRVLPFDFASLYPTTIIAYNIDYSTLVMDDSIPDSKCHVMKWGDHLACLTEDSNISSNGFGFKIKDLQKNKNCVLSHSDKTNKLEYKKQSNFFYRGKKECIQLTFVDGTTLKCTPDHRIMTNKHEWIEAKDLLNLKVKKSISYPLTVFEDYVCDFTISCGKLKLSMDTNENIEKFSKFSRFFGFLYTDSISINRSTCYVGDIVDAENLASDIYSLCNIKPNYTFRDNGSSKLFYITIPYEIQNSSIWKLGDGYGDRMLKDSKLPEYILDPKCPKILKREFLGGLFGGDGLSPVFCQTTKVYSTVRLCASKYPEKLENLRNFFQSIQLLLLNDFNIGSYLNGPYKKENEKSQMMTLNINVNDLIKFYNMIGFRYCTYKMLRLEILCSYKRLINNVFDQKQKCIKIAQSIKLRNKKETWDSATKKAHIIMKHDIIFNKHYSLPNKQSIIDGIRRPKNGNKKTFWSNNFPSFEKYLKELNVYKLFVDNKQSDSSSIYGKKQCDIDTIPYYEMKVIDIQYIGSYDVYDIEVKDNHSFLADGVVVHNCDHDPKVIRKKTLTSYIDERKKVLKELRAERDKKSNKLIKQTIIDKINQEKLDLDPYIKERSHLTKQISKKPMCEERYCRFIKEPKGVIPTILQNLLDARKNTRGEIKEHRKEIEFMFYYNGESKNIMDRLKIEDELECRKQIELQWKQHKKDNDNIYLKYSGLANKLDLTYLKDEDKTRVQDLSILNNVLDKRQWAYKISANSMYGAFGVRKGYLPCMMCAMATTFMGRTNIEKVAETIPSKFGGELVYGDTDSNYIHFPHLKTAAESWDYAVYVADEVTKLFPAPISLAFEEAIYWRFFILTKKRYMYTKCVRDGVVGKKIGKKGVLLSRRDTSVFIRNIYEELVLKIINSEERDDVLYYLLERFNKLCSNVTPVENTIIIDEWSKLKEKYENFVVTKSVGDTANMTIVPFVNEKGKDMVQIGDYKTKALPYNVLTSNDYKRLKADKKEEVDDELNKKEAESVEDYYNKCLPAQVQLAEKMKSRGQIVQSGSRIEYLITDIYNHQAKQYDKIESIDYFLAHSAVLTVDFYYYLRIAINSIDEILNIAYNKNDGHKYTFKKDFVAEQYNIRYKIRRKVLNELKELFKPGHIVFKDLEKTKKKFSPKKKSVEVDV